MTIEVKRMDGLPFFHEEVVTVETEGKPPVVISRSLANDALYAEHDGRRYVIPMRPIYAAITGQILEDAALTTEPSEEG